MNCFTVYSLLLKLLETNGCDLLSVAREEATDRKGSKWMNKLSSLAATQPLLKWGCSYNYTFDVIVLHIISNRSHFDSMTYIFLNTNFDIFCHSLLLLLFFLWPTKNIKLNEFQSSSLVGSWLHDANKVSLSLICSSDLFFLHPLNLSNEVTSVSQKASFTKVHDGTSVLSSFFTVPLCLKKY